MKVASVARPKAGGPTAQPDDGAAASQPNAIESALQILESSADFRILRRIKPQAVFSDFDANINVLILDTETSGMELADGHKVIEIGGMLVGFNAETGMPVQVYETYSELEYPGFDLDPDNIAVHGITNEDLAGKSFDEEKLIRIAGEADIVVCHNSRFDRPFLEDRFPTFKDMVFGCSLLDVEWTKNGYRSGKLEFIAVDQGKFYEAHRALEDCIALLSVLSVKMPNSDEMPFQKILTNCVEPSFIVGAYRSPFKKNQVLKKLGFTFNKEESIWEIPCSSKQKAREVTELLRSQVYETQDAITIKVKTLRPQDRFSNTPIIGEYFQIGLPQDVAQETRESPSKESNEVGSRPPSVSVDTSPQVKPSATTKSNSVQGAKFTPRTSSIADSEHKENSASLQSNSPIQSPAPSGNRNLSNLTARTNVKVAPPKRNNGPKI